MKSFITTFLALFLFLVVASPVFAVEVAPRISDREIIESLAELKAGQKSLRTEMNIRFNGINKRIDDMRSNINARFNVMIGIITIALGFLLRMQWQMNRRQAQTETSLETQKDEIAWLKEMINKLLPPKGLL